MVLNNLATMLVNTYKPDKAHFDKTWKNANGTTITEKGFITTAQAWSPGAFIALYIGLAFLLSTCIVSCVLYQIYDGDIMAAFRSDPNSDEYQADEENPGYNNYNY
jgi:hypothetical protein